MLYLFLKGLIIGLAIAAPVGPIGVLCINRSLHDGFKAGFATGMGAALADGVYGAISGFGLSIIANFLIQAQTSIQLTGGVFLLYLGLKTLCAKPPKQLVIHEKKINLSHAFVSTFFLTLTNPLTILSFAAVFAGLGMDSVQSGYAAATVLIVGIILGSMGWWLLLSTSVSLFVRQRIKQSHLYWINFASGIIILLFGLGVLIRFCLAWHWH